MTTDKIRAGAQALLDAIGNGDLIARGPAIFSLRAALAEPAQAAPAGESVSAQYRREEVAREMQPLYKAFAEQKQAAPAGDAVPAVAVMTSYARDNVLNYWSRAAMTLPTGEYRLVTEAHHLVAMESLRADLSHAHAAADANSRDAQRNLVALRLAVAEAERRATNAERDMFALQRDHLAATEALRQEVERLKAAAVTKQDASSYCRILTLLGMEEEGDPVAEVERLKSDRSAQVAEVMRLVDEVASSSRELQREQLGRGHRRAQSHLNDAMKATEAAVSKLAGGA